MILAEKRIYEVVFIVDPDTSEEDLKRLTETLSGIITERGGTITKNETMGRRQLAYKVGRKNEGIYVLFEIEGTGGEIAELERRMRVMDQVLRYLTVRVDEDRRRAEKLKGRRARKAAKRPFASAAAAGGSGATSTAGTSGEDEA
jgi:small subunit ribosomal protein S6